MLGTTPTEVGSVKNEKHKVYNRKRVSTNQQRKNRNSSSESKNSCRNTGDDVSISRMSPTQIPCILEIKPTLSTDSVSDRTNSLGNESGNVTEQYQGPELVKVNSNRIINVKSNEVLRQDMRSAHAFGNGSISPSSFPASKVSDFQANIGESLCIEVSEPPTNSQYKETTSEKSTSVLNRDVKINSEIEKTAELLGCYFHPMPVSAVLLKSVGNEIYICVSSFATEDRVSTLFMYKISAKAPSKGFPSIIGHTPAKLPIVDDKSGGNVNSFTFSLFLLLNLFFLSSYLIGVTFLQRTLERSYLHFTPDGEHLIFTGNIKTPYCRFGLPLYFFIRFMDTD